MFILDSKINELYASIYRFNEILKIAFSCYFNKKKFFIKIIN